MCVSACGCLPVQMTDNDIVMTLLEKNILHFFHAHLFFCQLFIHPYSMLTLQFLAPWQTDILLFANK